MIQSLESPAMLVSIETDPEQAERLRLLMARLRANSTWLQAQGPEVLATHRGRYIAVAGQELFVADNATAALALARAAHPEDDGILTQYVPLKRGARIYANRRLLARL